VFSIIYFIGMGGVTAVNLIPKLEPRYKRPPASGEYGPSRAMLWAFMYLVALGSGGAPLFFSPARGARQHVLVLKGGSAATLFVYKPLLTPCFSHPLQNNKRHQAVRVVVWWRPVP
jgi:hypothetical protein